MATVLVHPLSSICHPAVLTIRHPSSHLIHLVRTFVVFKSCLQKRITFPNGTILFPGIRMAACRKTKKGACLSPPRIYTPCGQKRATRSRFRSLFFHDEWPLYDEGLFVVGFQVSSYFGFFFEPRRLLPHQITFKKACHLLDSGVIFYFSFSSTP